MKKIFSFVILLAIIFLIICYLIPSVRQNEIIVDNSYENIISSVFRPRNWIKWDSSVKLAWLKDSSSCKYNEDKSKHIVTIEIPGKKITITQISYPSYHVEETDGHSTSDYFFSTVPYINSNKLAPEHKAKINYARNSRLLYKLFPFLEGETFAERNTAELKSYLNDEKRFYGFSIELRKSTDSILLTKKMVFLKRDFFKEIPSVFHELNDFAKANQWNVFNQNISFEPSFNDSVSIVAGVNIDKMIEGNFLFSSTKLPKGNTLAVAHYEGEFRKRGAVYKAIQNYMGDHQLVKGAAAYEKYLSPMPVSDSSIIKIELCCPLRTFADL